MAGPDSANVHRSGSASGWLQVVALVLALLTVVWLLGGVSRLAGLWAPESKPEAVARRTEPSPPMAVEQAPEGAPSSAPPAVVEQAPAGAPSSAPPAVVEQAPAGAPSSAPPAVVAKAPAGAPSAAPPAVAEQAPEGAPSSAPPAVVAKAPEGAPSPSPRKAAAKGRRAGQILDADPERRSGRPLRSRIAPSVGASSAVAASVGSRAGRSGGGSVAGRRPAASQPPASRTPQNRAVAPATSTRRVPPGVSAPRPKGKPRSAPVVVAGPSSAGPEAVKFVVSYGCFSSLEEAGKRQQRIRSRGWPVLTSHYLIEQTTMTCLFGGPFVNPQEADQATGLFEEKGCMQLSREPLPAP